jgi:squalene synthase HpnC
MVAVSTGQSPGSFVRQQLEIARGLPPDGCTTAQAEQYTRWLARTHYENFLVTTWLLPKRLRQPFYNLYAYCRWADDLGDEVGDPARALELLDWWEEELERALGGYPRHPVFVALAATIEQFALPAQPLRDLLRAFRQDQTVHRYADWDAVLGYCRYSANPVGRLVLALCGYRDAERQRLSDCTCTALQLANFWQDVARDAERGRIYIPLDRMAAYGVSEEQVLARQFSPPYAALMRELVARTRELFLAGAPLAEQVAPELRVDIELFTRGGLAVLDGIAAVGYDTLRHRPTVSRLRQMGLLARAVVARWRSALRSS